MNALIEKRSLTTKTADKSNAISKSVDWLKVVKAGGGLALASFAGIPVLGLTNLVSSAIEHVENLVVDKDARVAAIKAIENFKRENDMVCFEMEDRGVPQDPQIRLQS